MNIKYYYPLLYQKNYINLSIIIINLFNFSVIKFIHPILELSTYLIFKSILNNAMVLNGIINFNAEHNIDNHEIIFLNIFIELIYM